MLRTQTQRKSLFWSTLLAAAVVTTAAPGEAQAGRQLTRRTLPNGAQAPSAVQTSDASDPAVETGITRLLAASAGSGPTRAAAGTTVEGQGAHLTRSRGGYVRALVAPPGGGWTVARPGSDRTPEGLALAFLREHRVALGLSKRAVTFQSTALRRAPGQSYVRLAQRFAGLPVFGASVVVQVEESGRVGYVLSDIARDDADLHTPGFSVQASIDGSAAATTALGVVPLDRQVGLETDAPELTVYEPSVIGSAGPSRLVWHVRVRNASGDVNEVVLVDAVSGDVAFHYSDVKHAKSRSIYDHANVSGSLGTLVRSEGGPASGIADVNNAYDYLGDTYDFYFTRFGRDSYDGLGAPLVGRVRYCEPYECPYGNAYWSGSEMRFGQGFAAADDVVAHELTHAVTERESNLIYWGESGAINEAFSDIFGEFVDLTNTGGNDGSSVRWLIGEDLVGGAIRSMSDPTIYLDPDRRFSPNWYWESEDNRGVHYNSGVANKLAFLLTDGGSFNGQTVTGQGIPQVAGLLYEAQTNLLGPASDYFDLYAALRQAAKNQNWAAASRDSLEAATRAVEINVPGNVVEVFSDGFEGAFSGNWQVSVGEYWETVGGNTSATTWGQSSHRAATGNSSLYCAAGGPGPAPGPLYQPYMDAWVVRGPFSLDQAQAAWAEFDLFLDLEYPNDEVYWGVSTDGVNFDGYVVSPGPEGYSTGVEGTPGWSHELFNFKEIPGILGQPQVWLAFNFFSDQIVEYEGASIDNVSVLKAATAAPIGSFDTPADGSSGLTGTVSLQGWALDDLQVTQVSIYRDPVSGETPGPNGVHVGDATQVAGLRADIEAAYPTYPYAYKAGWNFDLLWSTLPSAGQGTFVFRALAYDADGRSTLLGSRTLTGAPAAPAVLTVVRAGVGSGLVVSTPPGIDCGLDCTESYVANTAISLTAIPDAGSVLVGWSGGCVGTGLSCNLTMDAAKSVTATFDIATETVIWTNRVGASAAGNLLTKTAATGWGNGGASSTRQLVAGSGGYAEFTLPATSGYAMFGLSADDADQGWADVDYALYTYAATNRIQIYEGGNYRGTFGVYTPGEKLRVSVSATGQVTYWQGESLIYTSGVVATQALRVDSAIYTSGAVVQAILGGTIENAPEPVGWTNRVGASAAGNLLTKTAATGWGNAGASSTRQLVVGSGGYAEFTLPATSGYAMFGLSADDADQGWADVDYALYTYAATNRIQIYEGGNFRGTFGTYGSGEKLRVSVSVTGQVTYWQGESLVYTSGVVATQALRVDSAIYTNGAVVQATLGGTIENVPALPTEGVEWTNRVGASAAGNLLTKTAATGWGNAGASSKRQLAAGTGGYAEFTLPATPGYAMFGLSADDADQGWADVDYALYTYAAAGQIQIYEGGIYRGTFGTYGSGETLRVSVSAAGRVTYWQGQSLIYTSGVVATQALRADSAIYTSGAVVQATLGGTIENVPALPTEAVEWTNLVGASAAGNLLTKTAATGWGNAGASSTRQLVAGTGGYAEFTLPVTSGYAMFGLSTDDADQGWADVDYALYTYAATNRIQVYEGGNFRGTFGTYGSGEKLRVSVSATGQVTYWQGESLIYTSGVVATQALRVDSAIYTNGAVVQAILGGTTQIAP